MGLSISASAAIFFAAFLVIFGTLYGSLDSFNDSINAAQNDEFDRYTAIMNTDIDITQVDAIAGTVTLENTGEVALNIGDMDILIDGVPRNDNITGTSVNGDTETAIWVPSEELTLFLTTDLTDARVKIVTENGVAAYYG